MPKLLPLSDFRARREILRPSDFAIGPRKQVKPTDLITRDDWRQLTILPDDVAVRTSNHNGTQLYHLVGLQAEWLDAVGDDTSEFLYTPILDAANEFEAASFDALHGYYRQALAGLRSACDSVSIAAACQVTQDTTRYSFWRVGTIRLTYGWACDTLGADTKIKLLESHMHAKLHDSIFAQKKGSFSGGWARRCFDNLSEYVHARPRFTNISMWASNGPIYDYMAFSKFVQLFVESTLLCHFLVAIARAQYSLPPFARQRLLAGRSKWSRTAKAAFRYLNVLPP